MLDALGPHASFILASYAVVAVVLGGLIAWLYVDGKAQLRKLADLEARGIRRGSRTRSN
ncbi:MAG: heme exporter protein CcmD [Pseudomonadota bacterium]